MLRPARVIRRPPPLHVRPADAALFRGELERTLPPVTLREMRRVRATAEGLLISRFRILPESFPWPHARREISRATRLKVLALNYGVRAQRELSTPGAWIIDTWSLGYFHWLADALPRLRLIADRLDGATLVLPHWYRNRDEVRDALEAFGVERVSFIEDSEVVRCDHIWIPDHAAPSGQHDDEILGDVRRILLRAYADPTAPSVRVYVSRRGAARRRIANEAAVVAIMQERGYRTVQAERLSFREQVSLFSRTRTLVSNHGAGLANMLFMPKGAEVVELRHERDDVNHCYFSMAAALRLWYYFLGCAPERRAEAPHTANITVDPDALTATLDLLEAGTGRSDSPLGGP